MGWVGLGTGSVSGVHGWGKWQSRGHCWGLLLGSNWVDLVTRVWIAAACKLPKHGGMPKLCVLSKDSLPPHLHLLVPCVEVWQLCSPFLRWWIRTECAAAAAAAKVLCHPPPRLVLTTLFVALLGFRDPLHQYICSEHRKGRFEEYWAGHNSNSSKTRWTWTACKNWTMSDFLQKHS